METVYLNGQFIPRDAARISPDDRGFLFADGIYEVVRWYGKDFFDMAGHVRRLKRSLGEISLTWKAAESFPSIAEELVRRNHFENKPTMVYLQVSRGTAKRTHYYPVPAVEPTSYAFAFTFSPDVEAAKNGIKVLLREDIRWTRCDIKSVALLPNTMSFQEAYSQGYKECIFVRDGRVTEGSHSNIFFVKDHTLYTHPESNFILSGISRNNALRMARELNIPVYETAINQSDIKQLQEAFVTNTSAEITPVIELGGSSIGNGAPGPVTRKLQEKFRSVTTLLKA